MFDKKNIILLLVVTCCSSVLCLAAGEYRLRVKEDKQLQIVINRYIKEKSTQFNKYKEIYSDEKSTQYKFGHNPNVRVKLTQGQYEFTFITNSEGLRENKDYDYIDQSVIFLGDSVVEGASVENDETMDSVFEEVSGIPTLNFGVSSRSVFLAYQFLKEKYRKEYNTKLIVYGFCLNDFHEDHVRVFDAKYGTWRFYRPLTKDFDKERGVIFILTQTPVIGKYIRILYEEILGLRINLYLQKLMNKNKENSSLLTGLCEESIALEHEKYVEFFLNKIREFAESIQSDFLVVIFPMQPQFKEGYCEGKLLQQRLANMLISNDIAFIDLYEPMRNAIRQNPNIRWFHDDAHPYKMGHKFIGETLADEIRKRYPHIQGH